MPCYMQGIIEDLILKRSAMENIYVDIFALEQDRKKLFARYNNNIKNLANEINNTIGGKLWKKQK